MNKFFDVAICLSILIFLKPLILFISEFTFSSAGNSFESFYLFSGDAKDIIPMTKINEAKIPNFSFISFTE